MLENNNQSGGEAQFQKKSRLSSNRLMTINDKPSRVIILKNYNENKSLKSSSSKASSWQTSDFQELQSENYKKREVTRSSLPFEKKWQPVASVNNKTNSSICCNDGDDGQNSFLRLFCLKISSSNALSRRLISINKFSFVLFLFISFLPIISFVKCNGVDVNNDDPQPQHVLNYSSSLPSSQMMMLTTTTTRSSSTGNNVIDNGINLTSLPPQSSISIVTLAPTAAVVADEDNNNKNEGTIVVGRNGQLSSTTVSTMSSSVNKSVKKSKSSSNLSSSMVNRKNTTTATITVNAARRKSPSHSSNNGNNNNGGNNHNHNHHNNHQRQQHNRNNRKKQQQQKPDVQIQTDLHLTDPEKTCLIGDACGGPNVGQSKRRGGGTGGYCYRPHQPMNVSMDDEETESFYELLTENCPHFFDENDDLLHPLCCTAEMEDTMTKLIMSVDLIRRSCPSCLTNVKRLFCNLFCAPNQRDFIRVDRVKGETVMEVTYAISEIFMENFFQSCQDVKVFGSYLMDYESACGKLKRANCTAIDFLHSLGSLQEIPFRFRPLIISQQLEEKIIELDINRWPRHIMNDTSYRCDEAPPDQSTCRCEHCSEMCLLSNYNPHKPVNTTPRGNNSNNRYKINTNINVNGAERKDVTETPFDGGHNDLDSTETDLQRQKQRDENYRINIRHVGKKKVQRSHEQQTPPRQTMSQKSSSMNILPNIFTIESLLIIAFSIYYLNQ